MNNIFVALRPRPQSNPSQAEKLNIEENSLWKLNLSSQATVIDSRTNKSYELDHLFSEESTNREIFERLILQSILESLEGTNLTIMAYGQTASGKTHTIYGSPNDPGLLNQSVDVIFREMRRNLVIFQLKISYLEVYNEQVNDLLDPSRTNLEIREQSKQGICVHRLSDVIVDNEDELFKLLRNGNSNRRTGKTQMNLTSSRSHILLRLSLETKASQTQHFSLISFVDLAGSESAQNIKELNIEGAYMKKSLLSLSLIIKALRLGNGDHAHFRGSKLTRLLQPFLCTNSKTVIVCTVNLLEETRLMTSQILTRVDANMENKCSFCKKRIKMKVRLYRGDFQMNELETANNCIKIDEGVRFIDWCPTGFKSGINYNLPAVISYGDLAKVMKSSCMISNSTAISEVFSRNIKNFNLMYCKRAFLHWYIAEGMEEGEFFEAMENLINLDQEYETMSKEEI